MQQLIKVKQGSKSAGLERQTNKLHKIQAGIILVHTNVYFLTFGAQKITRKVCHRLRVYLGCGRFFSKNHTFNKTSYCNPGKLRHSHSYLNNKNLLYLS